MASQNIWMAGRAWFDDAQKSITMCVFVRGARFDSHLCANQFSNNQSLLDTYSRHFRQACSHYDPEDDTEDYEAHHSDPLEGIVDWTMQFFHAQINGIPPLNTKNVYTLFDVLSARIFDYTLLVTEEGAEPAETECLNQTWPSGIPLDEQHHHALFPIYRPEDIYIPLEVGDLTLPPEVSKVRVCGQYCFFKHILPADVRRTNREISTYTKIAAADLPHDAHVPKFVGLVTDTSSSRLIGMLISYIECDIGKTLSCRGIPIDNFTLRSDFIRQVSHSIAVLYAHDIVWGDAKASNVLVDVDNKAWLIDFGGSFTHGWVDEELQETKKGDLQGLQRIKDFLLQAQI